MTVFKIHEFEIIRREYFPDGNYDLSVVHGESQFRCSLLVRSSQRIYKPCHADYIAGNVSRISVSVHGVGVTPAVCEGVACFDNRMFLGIVLFALEEPVPVGVVSFVDAGKDTVSRRTSVSIPSEPSPAQPTSESHSVTSDILSHFFSDIASTKQLIDTYKRWSIRCGPLRYFHESWLHIVSWTDTSATILAMLTWCWFCLDTNTALPLLLFLLPFGSIYCLLLIRCGVLPMQVVGTNSLFDSHDVETNLQFNNHVMSVWCDLYDNFYSELPRLPYTLRLRLSIRLILGFLSLLIAALLVPPKWLFLMLGTVPLLWTCPLVRETVVTKIVPKSKSTMHTITLDVYENQRWWLGNWSDKGLAIGTAPIYAWSDITGKVSMNKSDIRLPPGYMWSDLWHVDERGWTYAINFESDDWFHTDQRSSDFVRKRRWIRTASISPNFIS